MSTLEEQAKLAWKVWGHAWYMTTRCSGCGEVTVCRGRKRSRMICLDCFDQGKS